MSEHFKTIFAAGGKANSLGRARDVIEAVLGDRSRLDELVECVSDDDAWVRMRAIDTLEKVARAHPEWVTPYIDRLLHDVAANDQPSIQWHLAEIFTEVELTPDQRVEAITLMKQNISTTSADWIVAANCMKALVEFARKSYVSSDEIIPLLKIQQGHHSKAVIKKATQLLEEIS